MSNDSISNSPELVDKFYTLPLRDVIMFPQMITTILVGREKSISSINYAQNQKKSIFVVAQINPDTDEFTNNNLYLYGTICSIIETIKTPDGTLKVIIKGIKKARLSNVIEDNESFIAEISPETSDSSLKINKTSTLALMKGLIESFAQYSQFNKKVTAEMLIGIAKTKSTEEICYIIAPFLNCSLAEKQAILGEKNIEKQLYKVLQILKTEIEIGRTEEKISKKIQEKFTKHQKEIYLSEQIKNIKKELGQDEDIEMQEIKNKISKLPKDAKKKCLHEFSKLEKMSSYSSESTVIRNYLDLVISLPWQKFSKLTNDLIKAKKILDNHHYGLEKVKERILEFIAVQLKTNNNKGPILCLVGAPGVGKTSLAKSIAESVNRKYVKISLGGVKDESEIRGHRKTYIGSMPGRIIQSMKKAETNNPLILLDEIDKMSGDFRGDPASAMLEVLDPEQNNHFSDHYLELDYDLSKVMFIATANSLSGIPIPLRDRMEIIKLSGYTELEKIHIAKHHLLPKQIQENGLTSKELTIDDNAILAIIRNYTFEAGVRNLNREIEKIARKVVKMIVTKKIKKAIIKEEQIVKYLGIQKKDYTTARKKDAVGVITGLAYTEYGGDLLNIEVLQFEGGGKIQTTGHLGEVMKESALTALSYARFLAHELKIDAKKFNKYDFHVHVPEGATPKDGPSAGVALCVALVSVITNKKIKKDIAMTGEITLTGKVLEIGGLKEKLLAALRGQIKTVLIPESNKKDLEEMPKEITENLDIKTIAHVKEAIDICLHN
jgi:ATP-dependent Lon protease